VSWDACLLFFSDSFQRLASQRLAAPAVDSFQRLVPLTIFQVFFGVRRLLAELNFKASHSGIGRIPVTILIFRPGNFRPKLKKKPGPVKIPAIP